jgi:hypothetical protein
LFAEIFYLPEYLATAVGTKGALKIQSGTWLTQVLFLILGWLRGQLSKRVRTVPLLAWRHSLGLSKRIIPERVVQVIIFYVLFGQFEVLTFALTRSISPKFNLYGVRKEESLSWLTLLIGAES